MPVPTRPLLRLCCATREFLALPSTYRRPGVISSTSYFDDLPADLSPSVLLVDDDEVNLMITAMALRERGFVVTEAGSGERALELLGLKAWMIAPQAGHA